MPENMLRLSIVITTFSKSRNPYVMRQLAVMNANADLPFEVILIVERDKEAFDHLRDYAKTSDVKISVLFFPFLGGMSDARNTGARVANGEFISFLDDDAVPSKSWMKSLFDAMEKYEAIGFTGPAKPIWETTTWSWIPIEFEWLVGGTRWFGRQKVTPVRNAWGSNMAFRREEFLKAGGFRSDYGLHSSSHRAWGDRPSEDVDFSVRIKKLTGKRILYLPDMLIYHYVTRQKMSWLSIANHSFGIGYTRRAIQTLYKNAPEISLEPEWQVAIVILKSFWKKKNPNSLRSKLNFLSLTIIVMVAIILGYCKAYAEARRWKLAII